MLTLILFVFGLFIGSFLGVVVDRLATKDSFIKGRSKCDHCGHVLGFFDLFPIFSFVLLKGQCRYCHKKLSLYCPITEITTGILFAITFLLLSQGNLSFITDHLSLISVIYYLFIVSCLIVIFFADLRYGIIPDKILYPAVFVVFVFTILNTQYLILNIVFSAIGSFLFLFILYFITKRRGMGFGDVKYAFFMGLLLGFPAVVVGLYIAFLTGAVAGIILLVWQKKRIRGTTIPFGPFLVIGTYISLFWGNWILSRLVSLL